MAQTPQPISEVAEKPPGGHERPAAEAEKRAEARGAAIARLVRDVNEPVAVIIAAISAVVVVLG